jgi:hypothetical protein
MRGDAVAASALALGALKRSGPRSADHDRPDVDDADADGRGRGARAREAGQDRGAAGCAAPPEPGGWFCCVFASCGRLTAQEQFPVNTFAPMTPTVRPHMALPQIAPHALPPMPAPVLPAIKAEPKSDKPAPWNVLDLTAEAEVCAVYVWLLSLCVSLSLCLCLSLSLSLSLWCV